MTQPLAVEWFLRGGRSESAAGNKELAPPVSLRPGHTKDRNTLEAPIAGAKLPVSFELHVKFKPDDKDRLFDFTFAAYSKEPQPVAPKSQSPAQLLTSAPAQPAPTPFPAAAPPSGAHEQPPAQAVGSRAPCAAVAAPVLHCRPLPLAYEEALPTTTPALLAELAKRAQSVSMLLADGNLGGLWNPAIGAKDVALALAENHGSEVPEALRPKFLSAVKRLTMVAWQIDSAGDLGSKELVVPLCKDFSAAVSEIQAAYATP